MKAPPKKPWPSDAKARHQIRQEAADEAAAKAYLAGRTLACNPREYTPGHDHTTCWGAGTCLCPCHDVVEES
jgi:hypothetical protein